MVYPQVASSRSGVFVNGSSRPKLEQSGSFSQGGRMDLNILDARDSNIDYYFLKKLTWALEQLSLTREGCVNYESSGSESSTLPNSPAVLRNNGGNARRINLPLCKATCSLYSSDLY